MFENIVHIITFLLVASLIFPSWAIYRKTRSKAEAVIALGFSILAFIRLGIVFDWEVISSYSQQWTIVNTAIIAFGYWWLYFSSLSLWNMQITKKDQNELDQFREDQPGVDSEHTELGHFKDDQPGVDSDKVELTERRNNDAN